MLKLPLGKEAPNDMQEQMAEKQEDGVEQRKKETHFIILLKSRPDISFTLARLGDPARCLCFGYVVEGATTHCGLHAMHSSLCLAHTGLDFGLDFGFGMRIIIVDVHQDTMVEAVLILCLIRLVYRSHDLDFASPQTFPFIHIGELLHDLSDYGTTCEHSTAANPTLDFRVRAVLVKTTWINSRTLAPKPPHSTLHPTCSHAHRFHHHLPVCRRTKN